LRRLLPAQGSTCLTLAAVDIRADLRITRGIGTHCGPDRSCFRFRLRGERHGRFFKRCRSDGDQQQRVAFGTDSWNSICGTPTRARGEPSLYKRDEFRSRVAEGHHFLANVLRGRKLFLIGDEDEFGRLIEVRMAQGAQDEPKRDRRTSGRRRS
jgi:hypothetical protein